MARLQQRKQAAVTTGLAESTGIPCTMVLTLLRALPGVHDFLVTVASRVILRDLAPAQGRQDHTTSPSASAALVARAAQRPSHPAPNTRDDREAPLSRARDGADHGSDLGFKSSEFPKIIIATDWHDGRFAPDKHAQFSLGLSGKSVRWQRSRGRARDEPNSTVLG